jgi:hypothetical protein
MVWGQPKRGWTAIPINCRLCKNELYIKTTFVLVLFTQRIQLKTVVQKIETMPEYIERKVDDFPDRLIPKLLEKLHIVLSQLSFSSCLSGGIISE